ncbi:hypothetical protein C8J56DRAFT_454550 [Mycena floridula]|nr:hypothetical protein C8J56DRAFT_454550 [Mycena floridula]
MSANASPAGFKAPSPVLLSRPIGEETDGVDMFYPSSSGNGMAHRNETYYFDDELSIFLVENQLFKVQRHFLKEESQAFRWMFLCPPQSGGKEGLSDEHAIVLPGVTVQEFESLLDFFYKYHTYDHLTPINKWINLLSISTRFDFERSRNRAIQEIGSSWGLDPIEQIDLAEKYEVRQWLRPAYAALCQRANPLELSEAMKLGYERTVLIARAREAVRNSDPRRSFSPSPPMTPRAPSPMDWPVLPPPPALLYNTRMVARVVNEVFFPE